MIYEALADNIKYFRRLKSLSQLDLAELAKVNIKTITRAESGKQGIKFDVINKISQALDIEFYELFIPRSHHIEEDNIKQLVVAKLERLNKNKLLALNKVLDAICEIQ